MSPNPITCRRSFTPFHFARNKVIRPEFNSETDNIKTLNHDSNVFTDSTEIANVMNDYFTSIGRNIAHSINNDGNPLHCPVNQFPLNSFYFSPVSDSDVSKIIKKS